MDKQSGESEEKDVLGEGVGEGEGVGQKEVARSFVDRGVFVCFKNWKIGASRAAAAAAAAADVVTVTTVMSASERCGVSDAG